MWVVVLAFLAFWLRESLAKLLLGVVFALVLVRLRKFWVLTGTQIRAADWLENVIGIAEGLSATRHDVRTVEVGFVHARVEVNAKVWTFPMIIVARLKVAGISVFLVRRFFIRIRKRVCACLPIAVTIRPASIGIIRNPSWPASSLDLPPWPLRLGRRRRVQELDLEFVRRVIFKHTVLDPISLLSWAALSGLLSMLSLRSTRRCDFLSMVSLRSSRRYNFISCRRLLDPLTTWRGTPSISPFGPLIDDIILPRAYLIPIPRLTLTPPTNRFVSAIPTTPPTPPQITSKLRPAMRTAITYHSMVKCRIMVIKMIVMLPTGFLKFQFARPNPTIALASSTQTPISPIPTPRISIGVIGRIILNHKIITNRGDIFIIIIIISLMIVKI